MFEIIGIDFFSILVLVRVFPWDIRLLNIYNVVLNLYSTDKGF